MPSRQLVALLLYSLCPRHPRQRPNMGISLPASSSGDKHLNQIPPMPFLPARKKQWVCILEAATPDHPTVFAASPDHRIAPPLSYVELLRYFEQAAGGGSTASTGGSACGSSGRGAGSGRRGGAAESTGSMSRCGAKTQLQLRQTGGGRGRVVGFVSWILLCFASVKVDVSIAVRPTSDFYPFCAAYGMYVQLVFFRCCMLPVAYVVQPPALPCSSGRLCATHSFHSLNCAPLSRLRTQREAGLPPRERCGRR